MSCSSTPTPSTAIRTAVAVLQRDLVGRDDAGAGQQHRAGGERELGEERGDELVEAALHLADRGRAGEQHARRRGGSRARSPPCRSRARRGPGRSCRTARARRRRSWPAAGRAGWRPRSSARRRRRPRGSRRSAPRASSTSASSGSGTSQLESARMRSGAPGAGTRHGVRLEEQLGPLRRRRPARRRRRPRTPPRAPWPSAGRSRRWPTPPARRRAPAAPPAPSAAGRCSARSTAACRRSRPTRSSSASEPRPGGALPRARRRARARRRPGPGAAPRARRPGARGAWTRARPRIYAARRAPSIIDLPASRPSRALRQCAANGTPGRAAAQRGATYRGEGSVPRA